ncbi:hypothetical protein LJC11_02880 [Bacteroidales bacterium OttesenSCG-928-I21]|nr:hypothetical protein [Bacteroidales bacterium OttesenSCG-928-I21]
MKNFRFILTTIVITALIFCTNATFGQKLLKGVAKSYDDGVSAFNKKRYQEASEEFMLVLDNIPEDIEKRKYQVMRLDAASKLVEIHYEHEENLRLACRYIEIFFQDLEIMKNDKSLKTKDIYTYIEREREFTWYKRKCESFNTIDDKKSEFEKKFDEVFDTEE